jgi:NAD(P)-dependent dehydrogenase (short-subunit alcohol dehydrogenase family)
MKIANKTILITDANRGIGRALVDEALNRGAKRVYAGTRGSLQHQDKRATALTLDVTSNSQIQQAAIEVGTLDILINNAGIFLLDDDLSDSELIERQFKVNLLGPFNMTRAFLPQLKLSRGAIVNILSLAGLAPVPSAPAYSISKAALLSMTQSFRMLLASNGVSVHSAILGPIDTDMTRKLEIPKTSPEVAARGICDGFENGEEDIFPDPAAASIAEGWRTGVAKGLEQQFAGFLKESAQSPA